MIKRSFLISITSLMILILTTTARIQSQHVAKTTSSPQILPHYRPCWKWDLISLDGGFFHVPMLRYDPACRVEYDIWYWKEDLAPQPDDTPWWGWDDDDRPSWM